MTELIELALELAGFIARGELDKAERKAKALAQAIALKQMARELAKK